LEPRWEISKEILLEESLEGVWEIVKEEMKVGRKANQREKRMGRRKVR
jgi:hypothetical protein